MTADDDGHFGEAVAARYDETSEPMFEPAVVEPAVEFLAQLAGTGRALELGIGTGRIALPLAARGVEVHGIEQSQAMVARLRDKPGGVAIPVTIGDFSTARIYSYRNVARALGAMGMDFVFATDHASNGVQVDGGIDGEYCAGGGSSCTEARDLNPARFGAAKSILYASDGVNATGASEGRALARLQTANILPQVYMGEELDVWPEISSREFDSGLLSYGDGLRYPWPNSNGCLAANSLALTRYERPERTVIVFRVARSSTATRPLPTSVRVPSQRSWVAHVASVAVLIPAAPTIRNRPFWVPAVRLRTVLRPRPLIGPDALLRRHAASAPGALWSTRSVGIFVRAPGVSRC